MTGTAVDHHSNDDLQAIVALAEVDSERGITAIDLALRTNPDDPRLHFLRGSLLIGLGRFIEAHKALSLALAIAPDYEIARFQLGLFELTSGEANAAIDTWKPLKELPEGHWLLSFVFGLEHLVADRFADCIDALRAGIAANDENLPLNGDMQLVVTQCEALIVAAKTVTDDARSECVSSTSFLLGLDKNRRS